MKNYGSGVRKAVADMLAALRRSVMNDLTDQEAERLLSQLCGCVRLSINEHDFVNYDKALRILGMKTNRQKLNELCKANGIKNVKFNNAYIGFPREEIEALAARLKREKGG